MPSRKMAAAMGAALSSVLMVAGGALGPAGAATVPVSFGRGPSASGGALAAWGDNSAGELGDGGLAPSAVPTSVLTMAAGSATITQVSAGARHDLALLSDGQVLAWGDDTFGELGNGVLSADGDAETPAVVAGLSGVTAVAAGGEHSLALLGNGTVMAWGDNEDGQLGDGSTEASAVPVAVSGLTNVVSIAAGDQFSLALLANGTVVAWGQDDFGELGDNSLDDSDVPVAVQGLTGVVAISAAGEHSLALLGNGTVMSWGDNEDDQLGDGQDVSTQALSAVPVPVVDLTGAVEVAAGFEHSVALLGNGTVMAWGDNGFFQLAQPQGFPGGVSDSDTPLAVPGLSHVTGIAAGALFSLALLSNGAVAGWGDNGFGQLGTGNDATGQAVVAVKGLSGVTAISAGGASGLALVPAPAQGAGPSGDPGTAASPATPWQVLPMAASASAPIAVLGSVSASSADEAWAVGERSLVTDHPLAEHWDGTAWSAVEAPGGAGGPSSLLGVDDLSPTDAWAVGETGPTGSQRTLIEHWDGTAWSVVPSPNPLQAVGDTDELQGVAGTSPDDLWAVGTEANSVESAFLLEHFNGQAWTASPPPAAGLFFGEAVTVVSADDAWAVGETAGGTVSAHFNGSSWNDVATPVLDPGTDLNELTAVTNAGPDNIWASGWADLDSANFRTPYVLHFNGTAWSLVQLHNAGSEGSLLEGIAAVSARDIWAVGASFQSDGGEVAVAQQFNGTSWSVVPALQPGQLAGLSNNFFGGAGVAPGTTDVFTVGSGEMPGHVGSEPLAEDDPTG